MTGTYSPATAAALAAAGIPPEAAARVVAAALDEDLAYGPDVTSACTIPPDAVGVGDVVARGGGVVAGIPLVAAVLESAGIPAEGVQPAREDGSRVGPGELVTTVTCPLAGLLGVERVLLNLLTHLSGIATHTRRWVDAVAATPCTVRDTRKTTPGLRVLEKYATRCGGAANHRLGLGDAALVKDNHVLAAGGVGAAVRAVRAGAPGVPLEVECDTLEQLEEAMAAGAELVLLDNMDLEQLRAAVAARTRYPHVKLEASGGLRLDTVARVATVGVDFVAVGAITHSSPALDLGLDLRPASGLVPQTAKAHP